MIRPYHSGDNDNVAMIISHLSINYDNSCGNACDKLKVKQD